MRARVVAQLRSFFAEKDVLEVDTPLLSAATVTDPHLHALRCEVDQPGSSGRRHLHLQTSPEFAMKRLLAAGSGAVYEICKAFRDGEAGRLHNPEFTILEWYRPGFDHHRLMDEVDQLLATVLGTGPSERLTYAEAFQARLGIDALRATPEELRDRSADLLGELPALEADDRDGWLDLLMSHAVEPHLGRDRPSFIHDYPASQAALARIRPGDPPVAERFEVYVQGLELANGYHELIDAAEQERRFEADNARRQELGLPTVQPDARLLDALAAGLPDCAGVALGVDRLVMLAAGTRDIADVIAFTIDRA